MENELWVGEDRGWGMGGGLDQCSVQANILDRVQGLEVLVGHGGDHVVELPEEAI